MSLLHQHQCLSLPLSHGDSSNIRASQPAVASVVGHTTVVGQNLEVTECS